MKPSPTSIHVYQYNDPKSHYKRFQVRDCLIQLVPSALPFSAPHRHLTPKLTQASKKFYLIHPRRSFVGFDISWIWLFLIPTRDRHEMRSRLAPSHIQLGQLNFNSSLIDSKKDMHKFLSDMLKITRKECGLTPTAYIPSSSDWAPPIAQTVY